MKRSYTLIVVPHAGEPFRKIHVTTRTIKAVVGVAAAAMILAVGMAVHYAAFFRDVGEVRGLRLRNAELQRQNLDYELSVDRLNDRVGSLQEFVKKISIVAGLENAQEPGAEIGVGGPNDLDYTAPTSAYAMVKDDLDRMESELADIEDQSRVLDRFYEENTLMLASTPSIWPTRGYLSSTYGYRKDPFTGQRTMHYGVDISTPTGTPVVATADGLVLYANSRGSLGNAVVIDHKFGLMTRYGHLSGFNTRAGARVKRGDVIGYVGNTGRSRAPHLHYEVWVNDRPAHPLNYVLEYYRAFDPRNRPLPEIDPRETAP